MIEMESERMAKLETKMEDIETVVRDLKNNDIAHVRQMTEKIEARTWYTLFVVTLVGMAAGANLALKLIGG